MKHNILKQMGWRKGIRYFGDDLFSYVSFCYNTFDEFLSNEDYDIMDEYMDKEERYEIDGRYIILNRDLSDYVKDIRVVNGIKLVKLPVIESFNPTLYNDQPIYNEIKTIDTIMFRSDRMSDVITHLTYQMKKKRKTFLHKKTSVL